MESVDGASKYVRNSSIPKNIYIQVTPLNRVTLVPGILSRLSGDPNLPMQFSISFYVWEQFRSWRLVPIKRS